MPGVTVRDHAHQAPVVVLPDEVVVEPVVVALAPEPPDEPAPTPPDRSTEETR